MLELYFHPQYITAARIELQLIVVAEPMKLRVVRECSDRRQLFFTGQREWRRGGL